MKRLFALILALVVGVANADTTGNVLSGTAWTGVTNGTLPANRMPGSALLYDTATGTVNWSYNQATAAKTIAINNALSGSGVQVGGYNYTYDLRNMNGDDRQGSIDTMTVVTKMTSNTGATLLSNTNTHNTKFDWTTFAGTQSLNSALPLSGLGNLSITFTSKDSGFWAGYFGPEVRNVGMSLNYTVDPCVTNPAYSTTCANYNTVTTSGNLFTGTTGPQAYAINQALSAAGAGATIHGFDYGYNYSVAGRDCAIWNLFGVCLSGWNYSDAGVNTSLTNSAGTTIYTDNQTHNGGDNGTSGLYSKAYRLPSSVPMATLGTFSMSPWTSGNASITNMYSRAVYTVDPCLANPLSSTSCSGYAQAFHDQQCSSNPLYAVDCPGYATAYQTQQCTANPLYSPSCPGYETAYQTYQCSINPLYSTACPGYTQAYHDQQCSINPLYATDCQGYAVAYHDQQCRLNPLYMSDCQGYAQAYHDQQCSLNPLYMSDCAGYAVAYKNQQCSISPLYASDCPGYAVAYKTQQCTASALYATDCPGYTQAYHTQQCNLNPLYMSDCPGYAVAYHNQQCSISPLYATDCPGYAQAYFAQQCQANGLYDRTCPNYGSAYAAQQALKQNTSVSSTSTTTTVASVSLVPVAVESPVTQATTTPTTTSPTSVTSVTSVVNTTTSTASPTSVTSLTTTTASTSTSSSSSSSKESSSSSSSSTSGSTTAGAKSGATTGGVNERKNAEAKAKAASENMKNATKMEDQVAVQGAVLNSMAFVPGFSAYQNAMVPDILQLRMARQYSKPPIDNDRTRRLLGGAQEHRWNEMVDSQYQLGK